MTSRIDGCAGEHHHEAIDAHAEAGGGRHAVLERANVVLVVVHRLFVARAPSSRTCSRKRAAWSSGIVELAERVAELAAVDEELEAIDQLGARVIPARERRGLERVVVDEDGQAARAVLARGSPR